MATNTRWEKVKIKIPTDHPNHAKIFNYDDVDADGEPISDAPAFAWVTNDPHASQTNLFLTSIELNQRKNEVELTFPVSEKDKNSGTSDYCLFGLQYNPDKGYFYLGESALDFQIPLLNARAYLTERIFEVFFYSVFDDSKKDEVFTELKNAMERFSARELDLLFQKIKFYENNKVTDQSGFGEGIDISNVLQKLFGAIPAASGEEELFSESTFLASLIGYQKKVEAGESDDPDDEVTIHSVINKAEGTSDATSEWLNDFSAGITKYAIFYIKFFGLLGADGIKLPSGPVKTLAMQSASIAESLGGLEDNIYGSNVYSDLFSTDLGIQHELMGSNPYFNLETREIVKAKFGLARYKTEHEKTVDKPPDYDDTVMEMEREINEMIEAKRDFIKVANITNFTNLAGDRGLTGSTMIESTSVDDYNYLINHLERHGQDPDNTLNLCFESLQQSVRNVIQSKMVDEERFNNIMLEIRDDDTAMPGITFLTRQISQALKAVYNGFIEKIFS